MAKQVSFDIASSTLRRMLPALHNQYPAAVSFMASMVTAVLSCVASHPGDMLLTEVFKNSSESRKGTTRHATKSLVQRYGLAGLFLGIKARIPHVIAIVTPQLVIYDFCKLMLGLPATGSP